MLKRKPQEWEWGKSIPRQSVQAQTSWWPLLQPKGEDSVASALALGCALWNWVFQGCGSLLVLQGSWRRLWAVRQDCFKKLHQAPRRVAGSSQPALKDSTPRNGFLASRSWFSCPGVSWVQPLGKAQCPADSGLVFFFSRPPKIWCCSARRFECWQSRGRANSRDGGTVLFYKITL